MVLTSGLTYLGQSFDVILESLVVELSKKVSLVASVRKNKYHLNMKVLGAK